MGYYYKRLRDLREDNDYNQTQIATFLNIRQEYYSKYELGKIEIPAHMIIELAKFYKVSTDYILGMTDDPTPRTPSRSIRNNIEINFGNVNMNWGDIKLESLNSAIEELPKKFQESLFKGIWQGILIFAKSLLEILMLPYVYIPIAIYILYKIAKVIYKRHKK